MIRKTKTRSTKTSTKSTPTQLISVATKWQKKLTNNNLSPSEAKKIKREIAKINNKVRSKTVQQIKAKITTLKSEQAKTLGVKKTSPLTNTSTVKLLKAKITQINKCTQTSSLSKLCKDLKLNTYKNPTVKTQKTTKSKSTASSSKGIKGRIKSLSLKMRRRTKTLTREISKHKRSNSFLRRLTTKFRKKLDSLQRKYKAMQSKRAFKVIQGRKQPTKTTTSNVVRLSKYRTANKQRKYG